MAPRVAESVHPELAEFSISVLKADALLQEKSCKDFEFLQDTEAFQPTSA